MNFDSGSQYRLKLVNTCIVGARPNADCKGVIVQTNKIAALDGSRRRYFPNERQSVALECCSVAKGFAPTSSSSHVTGDKAFRRYDERVPGVETIQSKCFPLGQLNHLGSGVFQALHKKGMLGLGSAQFRGAMKAERFPLAGDCLGVPISCFRAADGDAGQRTILVQSKSP